MTRFKQFLCVAAAVAAIAIAPRAEAARVLQLSISDGINPTVLLTDLGGTGSLVHIGSIGNWILNVTSGTGYPITGTLDAPVIDLNSINVATTSGGTLTMMLTEIGIVDIDATERFSAAIGGTVAPTPGTTLTYAAYTDTTNAAFGTENLVGSGSFSGGAFAYQNTTYAQTGSLYSVTQVVTLTAPVSGTTTNISFNGELRAVPEPASMLLLGAGILGLSLVSRRRG